MAEFHGSHPDCWVCDHYEHHCLTPSGRECIACGKPAGTPWGPYWCPDCDVRRLDHISARLDEIAVAYGLAREENRR